MEKDCGCKYFEKEVTPSDKILKNFNIIATSEFDYSSSENGESTTILKCPKCSSYYILNMHNTVYSDETFISIKKYNPKTDENGLTRILKKWKGIITNKELDEYSELLQVAESAVKNMGKDKKDLHGKN